MGRHCQLVMGPAGSGKSSYCAAMQEHYEVVKRTAHVVNLDPAADELPFTPTIDIRELISLEDVVEELQYGPNGGLVYCLEYLAQNLDWLRDEIGEHEDDYLILDCPGQIELYTHMPVMRTIVDALRQWEYNVCGVYLIDAQFTVEPSKFMSGILGAMSAMVALETPHVNVLSKCDLIPKKRVRKFVDPDPLWLKHKLDRDMDQRHFQLNEALSTLIDEHSMVSFMPISVNDNESVEVVALAIDHSIQYGEDLEPKAPEDDVEVEQ